MKKIIIASTVALVSLFAFTLTASACIFGFYQPELPTKKG